MIFTELAIPGVHLLEPQMIEDDRGYFARAFCADEFSAHGIEFSVAQGNISYNRVRATLRGMHFQVDPHEEAKLVRCTAGLVFDVALDLRHESPTFLEWCSAELSASNRNAMYLPPGVAHGYLTLEDACQVEYLVSVPYAPAAERGVRWNDPAFGIEWPLAPAVVSDRDRGFSTYEPQA